MITYSMVFDSADRADRAAARLRSRGIALRQFLAEAPKQTQEPAVVDGYPYSYPANLSSSDYTVNLLNGLPQTNGNVVMMPLPFFTHIPAGQVQARFTVADADADRARRILINSGGAEVKIVH